MSQSLMAVVPHRKLMELKNSGVVKTQTLKDKADFLFLELREAIIANRLIGEPRTGMMKLVSKKSYESHLARDVEIMFENREALITHILEVKVPTKLVPLEYDVCASLLFTDRAAKYSEEADKVLSLFRLHDEVIVGSDTSYLINWLISNAEKIRGILTGENANV